MRQSYRILTTDITGRSTYVEGETYRSLRAATKARAAFRRDIKARGDQLTLSIQVEIAPGKWSTL